MLDSDEQLSDPDGKLLVLNLERRDPTSDKYSADSDVELLGPDKELPDSDKKLTEQTYLY